MSRAKYKLPIRRVKTGGYFQNLITRTVALVDQAQELQKLNLY